MVIQGKLIAEQVYSRLGDLKSKTLGILIVGSDSVTDSFVRAKEKAAARLAVNVVREVLDDTVTTDSVVSSLAQLSLRSDGVIVQLPLPSHIDTEQVLAAIPPEKDVDGIGLVSRVRPPVAGAMEEILLSMNVQVVDANAVVVGYGRLVGKPCAELLKDLGARVTILKKGDGLDALKRAHIVVLGAGEPGMVKPEHINDGCVLIDAGTSESSGKVVGDADPSCAEKCAVFTPVPGGVGPVAIAMIFKNLLTLS